MNDKNKSLTRISSVQRALKVLDFVAANLEGVEVKEVAYGMKINVSTCYHILNTLLDEDYIAKKLDGRYVLGTKIPRLNHSFVHSLSPERRLVEELYVLQKETGETAYLLGVKEENKIVIQTIAESDQAIRVNALYIGYSGNYHARAAAKIILAYWDEQKLNRYFQAYSFVKFTEKTPSDLHQLRTQLERIRNDGFCLEEEEFSIGICCVSAPIFGQGGEPIGSFGLTVPKERFLQKKQFLLEKVVSLAKKSSAFMGYFEDFASKISY